MREHANYSALEADSNFLEARLQLTLAENTALQERLARRDLYITYLEERLRRSPE